MQVTEYCRSWVQVKDTGVRRTLTQVVIGCQYRWLAADGFLFTEVTGSSTNHQALTGRGGTDYGYRQRSLVQAGVGRSGDG